MNANSALTPNRCQYRTATGRQCCSSATDPRGAFCARHAVAAATSDSTDFSAELIHADEHFQEAQQINHSLIALFKLVAAGKISPRRASVLAYIAHLILNTHKAIDYDNKRRLRPRIADPAVRPQIAPIADGIGPGTEPLPATAGAFVAEALKRKPS